MSSRRMKFARALVPAAALAATLATAPLAQAQDKTIELIRRNFWWPKMDKHIIDYIRGCPECQRNKST